MPQSGAVRSGMAKVVDFLLCVFYQIKTGKKFQVFFIIMGVTEFPRLMRRMFRYLPNTEGTGQPVPRAGPPPVARAAGDWPH